MATLIYCYQMMVGMVPWIQYLIYQIIQPHAFYLRESHHFYKCYPLLEPITCFNILESIFKTSRPIETILKYLRCHPCVPKNDLYTPSCGSDIEHIQPLHRGYISLIYHHCILRINKDHPKNMIFYCERISSFVTWHANSKCMGHDIMYF